MSYKLPELPYSYDALEPYYDKATVKQHYDVYHKAYVDALNSIEKHMEMNQSKSNPSLIEYLELEFDFRESGHQLHNIFWQNMCPGGSGLTQGILAKQINKDFGSFESFKKKFTAAALAIEGSGWNILVWNPCFKELEILQAEKNQNLSQWGVIPLLILDVWEHAYKLKYQDKRASWVEAWWNLVNWEDVLKRFEGCAEICGSIQFISGYSNYVATRGKKLGIYIKNFHDYDQSMINKRMEASL